MKFLWEFENFKANWSHSATLLVEWRHLLDYTNVCESFQFPEGNIIQWKGAVSLEEFQKPSQQYNDFDGRKSLIFRRNPDESESFTKC